MSELEKMRPIVGNRLTRVRRMYFVHGDEVDRSEGGVELSFSSGHFVFGDAGPDGDSMAVSYEEWADPFAEPLNPENREFVETSGKHVAFDVSNEDPFENIIGGNVMDIFEMSGVTGKSIGYVFDVNGEMLAIWVNSDETFATVLP
jgi:hypothetical protein